MCGLYFERGEQGYYLGAVLFNLIAAELVFVLGLVAVVLLTWPHPPWDGIFWGGIAVMILLPVLFFPFLQDALAGLRPHLPAVRARGYGVASPLLTDTCLLSRCHETVTLTRAPPRSNVGAMGERGREAGHSLVELLIAAALLSLVMAATLSILQSGWPPRGGAPVVSRRSRRRGWLSSAWPVSSARPATIPRPPA
jgi:hypothetical protein